MRHVLLEQASAKLKEGLKVGLLTSSPLESIDSANLVLYNIQGINEPQEAAFKLFIALRGMDKAGVDIIFAEGLPEKGIGAAVMNRLRKAAGKNIISLSDD